MRRCSSSMRREQVPLNWCWSGSGLPMPWKGSRRVASINSKSRLSFFASVESQHAGEPSSQEVFERTTHEDETEKVAHGSFNEDADLFISKYNNQVFVYNDEPFKEEDGTDFILVIEKALPRTKGDKEENGTVSDGAEGEESDTENKVVAVAVAVDTVKPSRREGPKKEKEATPKKARKSGSGGAKPKGDRPASVSESSQPDPRWANELSKLKEMFAAQTSN